MKSKSSDDATNDGGSLATVASLFVKLREEDTQLDALEHLLSAENESLSIILSWMKAKLRGGRIGVGPVTVETVEARLPPPITSAGPYTLPHVEQVFDKIASESGKGSRARREAHLHDLMAPCSAHERWLLGTLLSGQIPAHLSSETWTGALSRITRADTDQIEPARRFEPDPERFLQLFREEGMSGFVRKQIGTFIRPMRMAVASSMEGVLARWTTVQAEPILAGIRLQLHRAGNQVWVFEDGRDITDSCPDVERQVRAWPWNQCIVDVQAQMLDAQERPLSGEAIARVLHRPDRRPLHLRVFDLLVVDDHFLTQWPLTKRTQRLDELPSEERVPSITTGYLAELSQAHQGWLESGATGLVLKRPRSAYSTGRQRGDWKLILPGWPATSNYGLWTTLSFVHFMIIVVTIAAVGTGIPFAAVTALVHLAWVPVLLWWERAPAGAEEPTHFGRTGRSYWVSWGRGRRFVDAATFRRWSHVEVEVGALPTLDGAEVSMRAPVTWTSSMSAVGLGSLIVSVSSSAALALIGFTTAQITQFSVWILVTIIASLLAGGLDAWNRRRVRLPMRRTPESVQPPAVILQGSLLRWGETVFHLQEPGFESEITYHSHGATLTVNNDREHVEILGQHHELRWIDQQIRAFVREDAGGDVPEALRALQHQPVHAIREG